MIPCLVPQVIDNLLVVGGCHGEFGPDIGTDGRPCERRDYAQVVLVVNY
jgi:hypothetical protein